MFKKVEMVAGPRSIRVNHAANRQHGAGLAKGRGGAGDLTRRFKRARRSDNGRGDETRRR